MRTEPRIPTITDDELHAFAQKVEGWIDALTPNERALLGLVLQRAREASEGRADDTAGYGGDLLGMLTVRFQQFISDAQQAYNASQGSQTHQTSRQGNASNWNA